MNILGLSNLSPNFENHDASAALLIDGKLSCAVSEDRFSGIKHHFGYPAHAIQYCLQKEGLRFSDIDKILVGYGLLDDNRQNTSKKFVSISKQLDSFEDSLLGGKILFFMTTNIFMQKQVISSVFL